MSQLVSQRHLRFGRIQFRIARYRHIYGMAPDRHVLQFHVIFDELKKKGQS